MNVDKKFNELIDELSNEQFWKYVKDDNDCEQFILDYMSSWDDETKKDEIKKLKKILGDKRK